MSTLALTLAFPSASCETFARTLLQLSGFADGSDIDELAQGFTRCQNPVRTTFAAFQVLR